MVRVSLHTFRMKTTAENHRVLFILSTWTSVTESALKVGGLNEGKVLEMPAFKVSSKKGFNESKGQKFAVSPQLDEIQ